MMRSTVFSGDEFFRVQWLWLLLCSVVTSSSVFTVQWWWVLHCSVVMRFAVFSGDEFYSVQGWKYLQYSVVMTFTVYSGDEICSAQWVWVLHAVQGAGGSEQMSSLLSQQGSQKPEASRAASQQPAASSQHRETYPLGGWKQQVGSAIQRTLVAIS